MEGLLTASSFTKEHIIMLDLYPNPNNELLDVLRASEKTEFFSNIQVCYN